MFPSPFGVFLREKRRAAGKSLREVATALSVSHVYLGEIERGGRRMLPERYWKELVKAIPGIEMDELRVASMRSEPIDPSAIEGPGRDVVVALARAIREESISEDMAEQLLKILERKKRKGGQ